MNNRSSYLMGAALGSALVLAFSVPANAADIYDGGYSGGLKGGYEVAPPSDRGIYIKGFIGQANPNVGSLWHESYAAGNFTVHDKDIKSSPLFGLGIGWQARHWLRFDLTGEYRGDATFVGYDTYTGPAGANDYQADIRSWLGLANAYIDMGNWCGFTPFIGAGIGFASLTVDGLRDVNVGNDSVGIASAHTKTNFAYAFYAGFSYDVTPSTVIDLTYRWADLGSAQSGPISAYDGSSTISGLHIRNVQSNDLMLGVRYKLQREQPAVYAVK